MKTISLKLAKEIHALAKEKGVVLPESEKSHTKCENKTIFLVSDLEYGVKDTVQGIKMGVWCHSIGGTNWSCKQYNAYTTDELLEIIGDYSSVGRATATNYYARFERPYKKGIQCNADTPAEALGLLYKTLLEKDLIKGR